MGVLLQPKRQGDEQPTHEHGVDADDPDQRERSSTRSHHDADTEQHRDDAAQDQVPLVVDLLAQLDRADDLKHPGRRRATTL
jgi:hypothetical protein